VSLGSVASAFRGVSLGNPSASMRRTGDRRKQRILQYEAAGLFL
jgi:hypothetical protein